MWIEDCLAKGRRMLLNLLFNPRGFILIWCFLGVIAPVMAKPKKSEFDLIMAQAIEAKIIDMQLAQAAGEQQPRYFTQALAQFYQQRNFRPVWTAKSLTQLIHNIEILGADGLRPQDYSHSHLKTALPIVEMRNLDAIPLRVNDELRATGNYLMAIYHLYFGKVDHETQQARWQFDLQQLMDVFGEDLADVVENYRIDSLFKKARPDNSLYQHWVDGLHQYQQYAAAGGWSSLENGSTLKPCVFDPQVAVLRNRLRVTGEYTDPLPEELLSGALNSLNACRAIYPATSSSASSSATNSVTSNTISSVLSENSQASSSSSSATVDEFFDPRLVDAVKQFQRDQYLEMDGSVGAATKAALNISVQERIDQIRVNLDRARSVLRQMPAHLVLVDLAGFKVIYYKSAKPVWESRVQVGMTYRASPLIYSDIHYLTLNPTWTVPPTILRKDVLPKIRKDIEFLNTNNIHVFDSEGTELDPATINWVAPGNITLRQDAGNDAALGKAVIRFPNPYSIYLHDTPYQRLFKRSQRAYSSGCIRVEKILELVELLLNDTPGFDKAEIDKIIQSGKTRNISLASRIPVMLAYWTIEYKENYKLVFKPDIYRRDQIALEALNQN
jgi:L,D-transpeptidase YcbB